MVQGRLIVQYLVFVVCRPLVLRVGEWDKPVLSVGVHAEGPHDPAVPVQVGEESHRVLHALLRRRLDARIRFGAHLGCLLRALCRKSKRISKLQFYKQN